MSRLRRAPGNLPPRQPPLKAVHVQVLEGLVFVCLADEPPADFGDMAQRLRPYLGPHMLGHTKVAKQVDIIEHGNWKLTIENNRECFHCVGHPELLTSLFEYFGREDEAAMSEKEKANFCRFRGCAPRLAGAVDTLQPALAADRGTARPRHGLSHRAPGARWRRGIDDARHAGCLAPAPRGVHRAHAWARCTCTCSPMPGSTSWPTMH